MSKQNKRREIDMMKLIMKDYKVDTIEDSVCEFHVDFHGPADSLYEGGVWKIRVKLPEDYPFKCPSITFITKIYHPNINEKSGEVCLDVIHHKWSPMFDLVNVFEMFLPQLLLYPEPSHGWNIEALRLLTLDRVLYEKRIKEYCEKYAKPESGTPPEDEVLSEDECLSSDDGEVAGKSDPSSV